MVGRFFFFFFNSLFGLIFFNFDFKIFGSVAKGNTKFFFRPDVDTLQFYCLSTHYERRGWCVTDPIEIRTCIPYGDGYCLYVFRMLM